MAEAGQKAKQDFNPPFEVDEGTSYELAQKLVNDVIIGDKAQEERLRAFRRTFTQVLDEEHLWSYFGDKEGATLAAVLAGAPTFHINY